MWLLLKMTPSLSYNGRHGVLLGKQKGLFKEDLSLMGALQGRDLIIGQRSLAGCLISPCIQAGQRLNIGFSSMSTVLNHLQEHLYSSCPSPGACPQLFTISRGMSLDSDNLRRYVRRL